MLWRWILGFICHMFRAFLRVLLAHVVFHVSSEGGTQRISGDVYFFQLGWVGRSGHTAGIFPRADDRKNVASCSVIGEDWFVTPWKKNGGQLPDETDC